MKFLTLAGAGAGKTRSLVNEVKSILPNLAETPYRFCAVITYTKAATEVIRRRLAQQVPIPNNVFIGTTHSFFIRFIIEPYAHLLKIRQKDGTYTIIAPHQRSYIDCIDLPESYAKWFKGKFPNPKERNIKMNGAISNIIKSLCEKGHITYDKILHLSKQILESRKVRELVSQRLNYVFIDEYQDITESQHRLFQLIYDVGNTHFSYIGDPLQSIFKFTYAQNQIPNQPRPKSFNDSPILQLTKHKDAKLKYIYENHRSSEEIVELTNNFTSSVSEFKQKSVRGKLNLPVVFIQNNLLSNIIQIFEMQIGINNITPENKRIFKLLLAHSFKPEEFSKAVQSQQVEQLDYENLSINNQIREVAKCIQGVLGMKKKDILEKLPYTNEFEKVLEYRSFCLNTLQGIKKEQISDLAEYAKSEMTNKYGYSSPDWGVTSYQSIDMQSSIKSLAKSAKRKNTDKYYSTIHKAKGLEATCVLVCAKSAKELEKWLDYEKAEENDDDYRLGYVAFSRARNFLCISCLEKPSLKTQKMIQELNFKIV
ncbi:MAG TPA: UvrD-helicase domain-containing protein [Pyrinomonadaceae bacterium]|nr:UvrD-helicase domain-containing protein [Pyrinomonadaceae bacterium]